MIRNLRQTHKEALDRQGICLTHQAEKSSAQRSLGGRELIQQIVATCLPNQQVPAKPWRTMSSLPYRSAAPSIEHVNRQTRRSQHLARYETVRRLHRQGLSLQKIAAQLDLLLRTVQRFVKNTISFAKQHLQLLPDAQQRNYAKTRVYDHEHFDGRYPSPMGTLSRHN